VLPPNQGAVDAKLNDAANDHPMAPGVASEKPPGSINFFFFTPLLGSFGSLAIIIGQPEKNFTRLDMRSKFGAGSRFLFLPKPVLWIVQSREHKLSPIKQQNYVVSNTRKIN
jgi:hypothetical protein